MEITGRIKEAMGIQQGEGRNGQWRRATYVIEYKVPGSSYTNSLAFDVTNDNIEAFNIQPGQDLTISIDIDAREVNGSWFNTIRAWRVVAAQAEPTNDPLQPNSSYFG
ncbi:MAG: DUF3127 domain-containing protein [Paludibacteraceae bacterium]|nr:DUF3127 domain-containing protein [Paludibacteraceae bacterium]